MNRCVQVNGLDLCGLSACFITLRAWKLDGRCAELTVKAHALKGQRCVHCRLIVGEGYVTIMKGESIRRFFEHAEEAEEDEVSLNQGEKSSFYCPSYMFERLFSNHFVNFSKKNFIYYVTCDCRMMIRQTRMERSLMENAPGPKSMQRAQNLLESFFQMLLLSFLKNRHVKILPYFRRKKKSSNDFPLLGIFIFRPLRSLHKNIK